jgi:uncharacterized protein (TIGR03000 family)
MCLAQQFGPADYYGKNPYYYASPFTSDIFAAPRYERPFNFNVYTYPASSYSSFYPASSAGLPATIHLYVPAGADVSFNGIRAHGTGTLRRFATPPLNPDISYTYRVRARWADRAGAVHDETRQLPVRAGGLHSLDFNEPASPDR